MAPSAWICGECTFKDDGSKPGPCLMCQAPHPKCRALASVPAPCVAPPNNDDDNDDAFSKSMSDEVASLPSPCAVLPNDDNDDDDDDDDNNDDDDAFSKSVSDVDSPRAEGLVIDIAGIAAGDRGYRRIPSPFTPLPSSSLPLSLRHHCCGPSPSSLLLYCVAPSAVALPLRRYYRRCCRCCCAIVVVARCHRHRCCIASHRRPLHCHRCFCLDFVAHRAVAIVVVVIISFRSSVVGCCCCRPSP